jgi:3-oxoacyl-[acyl-carrier protein] reductase
VQDGAARQQGVTPDVIAEHVRASIPAGRLGETAEFGAACAFLCSAQAGFITGQSLLIDGGAYSGIL